jgi:EAL domain-containing protein (putative c-di-GMP-specific phosphodiesterase class I)
MASFEINAAAVREAIEKCEFVPYFQPIIELLSGRLAGFEALARWVHPTLGIIYPNAFIHVAEQCGLLDALSEYLLSQASIAASQWPDDVRLSFNLSPRQLCDQSLAQRIRCIVQRTGFPLQRLTLEVTELSQLGDLAAAFAVVEELKSHGVQLAIDDFGVGFSGLRRLQDIPFDVLKVDASFTKAMMTQADARKIVSAVVGLAQSLGLRTVAEGVEDQGHANMLSALGCDFAQGWLYGRAVSASLAREWHSVESVATRSSEVVVMPSPTLLRRHLEGKATTVFK